MSAIAGIVSLSGAPLDRALIRKITVEMRARGPDAQTTWENDTVALGHCMLRTTPEAIGETQPLVNRDATLRIVFDGRLDNRPELIRTFATHFMVTTNSTDAALVLAAYELWGEVCPERLLGDFAFALYDERRKAVFCARDHIGCRPFFFVQTGQHFAFASEDDPLLCIPGIEAAPNEHHIATALDYPYWLCMTSYNWLRDVALLMPGRSVTIHLPSARVEWRTYWSPQPLSFSTYASLGEAKEAFHDVFGEAVRARLRIAGSPAMLLSGGMDSGAIVATIARLKTRANGFVGPLHTYSTVHDDPAVCVETRAIETLIEAFSDAPHRVFAPSFAGEVDLKEFASFLYDRPHPVDISVMVVALMCIAARQNGHRVLLHGASGDLCNDIPSHYIAHRVRRGHWLSAWQECRAASHHHTYSQGVAPIRLLVAAMAHGLLPASLRQLARRLSITFRKPGALQVPPRINAAFAKRLKMAERMAAQRGVAAGIDPFDVQAQHLKSLFPTGVLHGLEAYERVGGRNGVEMRDPFADKRVIEFFMRLPLDLRVNEGWTKFLVRSSFEGQIPETVLWSSNKRHVGPRVIEAVLPYAVGRMLGADSACLDVLRAYCSASYVEQIAGVLAISEPLASMTHLDLECAIETFPLALWLEALRGDD